MREAGNHAVWTAGLPGGPQQVTRQTLVGVSEIGCLPLLDCYYTGLFDFNQTVFLGAPRGAEVAAPRGRRHCHQRELGVCNS